MLTLVQPARPVWADRLALFETVFAELERSQSVQPAIDLDT